MKNRWAKSRLALLLALALGPLPSRAADDAVSVKGSDTMVVLVQRWAEAFARKPGPGPQVMVTGGGSGTGLAALRNGTTQVAMSSREISAAERKGVQEKWGEGLQEIAVAQDGVAFYVHASNPLQTVTMAQLRAIYLGDLKDWRELGLRPGRIVPYSRESSSGTYQFVKDRLLKEEDFAPETQSLPGTAAVVNAVSQEPRGIGYGGAAFARGVRELKIRTNEGEVAPTVESIRDGRYPLSRKLYFYLRKPPEGAARAFIDFCLSEEGQSLATSAGYYPIRP